ncbi:MAG TPA: amino acid racemase [Vicinamibacterales bacterium]|nr:amino acid racemase [Vicinamibacterales bacterium]
MTKSQHIGIVAVSAEGAALCYRTICVEGAALFGAHDHPEITMHTYSLAEYMRHIENNRWDEVGQLLLLSATKVVNSGAEMLVCPDNTVHQAVDLIRAHSPAPWLHIAEEVAAVAAKRNFHRLGILGTRYLMEGPVYTRALAERAIAYDTPDSADRERINAVIFDELVRGEFKGTSRRYFQDVIDKLADRGCDAVVLGCTEIPLLIAQTDSALPVIDSTRTLARAALREAAVRTIV